ncbi:MAG: hypothetical protein WDM71_00065 [Ferruginibacter sp.]
MKSLSLFSFVIFISINCFAQHISKEDLKVLNKKEDSLEEYSLKIIQSQQDYDRFVADSMFTKTFVRALKTPNSFYYPFDSLETISKLYAPDSSFRIYTWELIVNDEDVQQHGAIQMRTDDGSLKLFPLIDKSDLISNLQDTITDNRAWIGAVYYRILETKNGNQNCYTLLGYDENNIRSTKKLIDVLTFENSRPIFGGPYFSFEEDSVVKNPVNRYIVEFKKDAAPRLNYDSDMGVIVVEHLESETNEPNKKWTLIPDGDYEGFKWKNNKWVHIDKIFHYVTPEGQEPVPDPVKDNNKNLLGDKLTVPKN